MFKEKAIQIIRNYVKSTYSKIEVNPGLCRFNYKCHMNSVNDAISNNEDKIALVMVMDNEDVSIHFINVNKKGVYTDNTLGHWASTYDYYFVEYIYKENFFNIGNIFNNYRIKINKILPWWFRDFIPLNTF